MADAIFIFRRDLRLADNTALLRACRESDRVLACFILDPAQLSKHPYFSAPAFRFMLESLRDLSAQLSKSGGKLMVLKGRPEAVVAGLLRTKRFSAVYANADYTPFSKARDEKIAQACRRNGATFIRCDDALLTPPSSGLKKDGTPYTVFTPYFKNAQKTPPPKPEPFTARNLMRTLPAGCRVNPVPIPDSRPSASLGRHSLPSARQSTPNSVALPGGRASALRILSNPRRFSSYARVHDLPALDATTHLSAHLKFGTVSAREAYWAIRGALGAHHPLIRQLHWRDFFTQIAHHFPRVFGHPFHRRYERIRWTRSAALLKKWQEGRTGFPLVDAAMRELNETGFMHNRCRMVVASFLVKDLHLDWRLGERYFAMRLVDYDPCVNNGNWQWAASTGADAQPYFRVFNPWTQQKKFDPKCVYIQKWVPELAALSSAQIHALSTARPPGLAYPKPVVDHAKAARWAIDSYKRA